MIFHDLAELKAYIDHMVLMGLGHARPMLDRRCRHRGDANHDRADSGERHPLQRQPDSRVRDTG